MVRLVGLSRILCPGIKFLLDDVQKDLIPFRVRKSRWLLFETDDVEQNVVEIDDVEKETEFVVVGMNVKTVWSPGSN